MPFYLVFGSRKRPIMGGGKYLDWANEDNPLGVYQADNPEDAMKLAASDANFMGTFFAIEGTPWGLELMTPEGSRLGSTASPSESMTALIARMEERDRQLNDQIGRLLSRGDD